MANRNDQILRFLVQAEGADALKPFLESVKELEGASEETRAAAEALLQELEQAAGLEKTLAEFQKLDATVSELGGKYEAAKEKVDGLAAKIAESDNPTKRQVESFNLASTALEKLQRRYDEQQQKLSAVTSTLQAAGIATDDFAAAQGKINGQAAAANEGLTQLAAAAKTSREEQEALAAKLADGDEQFRRQAEASRSAREALDGYRERAAAAAEETAKLGEQGSSASGVLSKLKGVAATVFAAFSVSKIVSGIRSVITEASAGEQSLGQLRAALASTGREAEFSGEALAEMGKQLRDSSMLDPDQITNAQTRLLTYTNIVGEQFPAALQLAADQSARLGISIESSSEIIGKALQTPSKAMEGLAKQGFILEEGQKELLETLEKTGRMAEAQAIIIDLLTESYGGAAAAQRLNTAAGLWKSIQDQFANFKQSIADAGVFQYAKDQLALLLAEAQRLAADGTLARWARETADGIKAVSGVIVSAVQTAYEYSGAILALGKAYATIKVAQLTADMGLLIARKLAAAQASVALAGATAGASTAMGTLGAAIGRIPTAVKVGIAIVGIEMAITSLSNLADAYSQLRAAQARLGIERSDLAEQEGKLAVRLAEVQERYAQYADVGIKTSKELRNLSKEQADAYLEQLRGAEKYFRALEIQARRTGDVAGLYEATQQLHQLKYEVGLVETAMRSMAAETTVVQPQLTAFAQTLIQTFKDAYREGSNAAQIIREEFGKIDVTTVQGLTDAIDSIRGIGDVSAEAGAVLQRELREKLIKLSDSDLQRVREVAEATFRAGSAEAKAFGAAVNGINLARLGVDITQLQTGFSTTGAAAVEAFRAAVKEVETLGLTAQQQSAAIAQAFDGAFGRLSSRPELEAMRAELTAAFQAGKISADEYAERLAAVQEALDRLRNAAGGDKPGGRGGASGALREVNQSAEEGEKVFDFLGQQIDKADAAFRDLDASAQQVSISLGRMSEEFARQALEAAGNSKSMRQYMDTWNAFNRVYEEQNEAYENRLKASQAAIASMDEEEQALDRLRKQFSALNDSDLKKLLDNERRVKELREQAAKATDERAESEKRLREELQQTADSGSESTVEYEKRWAVDVRVSADASAGGQQLSQAVLDQLVAKLAPVVSRAVLDEIKRDMAAAGMG